jgi:hypothetical protein
VHFTLKVNDYTVFTVPISVLQLTGTTEHVSETETLIKFNFKTFMESIPTIRMRDKAATYVLTAAPDLVGAASLVVALKYMDTAERRAFAAANRVERPVQSLVRLQATRVQATASKATASKATASKATASKATLVQAIESTEENTPANVLEVREFPKVLCKGFLVEGCNINQLDECAINLTNKELRVKYGRDVLRTIAERLSPTTFYLPFNTNIPFSENGVANSAGSIDYSQTGLDPSLALTFSAVTDVRIYAVAVHKFVSGFEWSANTIPKPITVSDRLECPITLEPIAVNQKYATCGQCSHNFSHEALASCFEGSQTNRSCPMCRSMWTNYNVYVNVPLNEGLEPAAAN